MANRLATPPDSRHHPGMVAIENIQDRESFEAWLGETNRPRNVCVALAVRAALRVLPLVWTDAETSGEFSALPSLRANLIASVGSLAPSEILTRLGHASALRVAANAAYAAYAAYAAEATHAHAAAHAAAAAYAANAAYAAYAAEATHAYAATHVAKTTHTYAAPNAANAAWSAVRSDCTILAESSDLRDLPLFACTPPDWFNHAWVRLGNQDFDGWSFWLDWYQRLLGGREQNWPLLLEIATQNETFWHGSDDEVNARIAEIAERHALTASYATRHVVVDEQTKLLRAELITEIERGFFEIALGRLHDAVDEMRAAPGFANQYTALEPELRRIDDYLARHRGKPLRIYEVAMRTCRLIRAKIEDGQLPEHDPLLEDFQTEVDNTALDILRGDPEVEKVVRQRSAGRFDRLDQAQKEHFRGITPQIIPICEDSLARELQEEIATATDPEADSQDQAEAMWRWAGLVLRIFRVVRERVHDYAAYVTLANAERGHFISFFL